MRGLYPSQPVVGVGSLVLRGQEVLLVRRAVPPDQGKWAIPGGKVELGERLYDAVKRELEEETGLSCEPLGVVNVDEIITQDEDGRVMFHYVLVTVLMNRCLGAPRAASDALEVRYFPIVEATSRNDVAASTKGFLRKLSLGMVPIERPIAVETSSSR